MYICRICKPFFPLLRGGVLPPQEQKTFISSLSVDTPHQQDTDTHRTSIFLFVLTLGIFYHSTGTFYMY
jgi:hypothetical protein